MRSGTKYVRARYGAYRINVIRMRTRSGGDEGREMKNGREVLIVVRSDMVFRRVSSVMGGGGAGAAPLHCLNPARINNASGRIYLEQRQFESR